MAANIIIGVGGTGAKVVESVLHAAAAGLGPRSLHVGFVDQDRSNGNVSRSRLTLETIIKAREQWRAPSSPHRLGSSDLLSSSNSVLGSGLWVPHEQQRASLAEILGDLQEDQPLFDLLFAKGASEQDMRLDEGYRGRAHVGSAAITSALDENVDFWRAVLDLVRAAKGGEVVRIMLVGSVFGGTGAAGFPTIARLIRRVLEREGIQRNIMLGGALMLPYFKFSSPEDQGANVARSEDLLPQTRGALRYYHSLFSRESVFDELYLVGWSPPFNLGYHSPGTGEQRNPALVPELVAALGVCRFFEEQYAPADPVLVIAREDERAVNWSDLPSPAELNPRLPYDLLGKQLRFAAAWKHWHPILARRQGAWNDEFARHAWFQRHGLGEVNYDASPPTETIRSLAEYIEQFIAWAGTMGAYGTNPQLTWGLWDCTRLLDGGANFENPTDPVRVVESLTEPQFGQAFSSILPTLDAVNAPPTAADLHRRLNEEDRNSGAEGVGRLVDAMHDYSAVQAPVQGK